MAKLKEKLEKEVENTTVNNRQKLFEKALLEVGAKFKDFDLSVLTKMPAVKVETISTGSLILDSIIGGGLAKGRIIEIYGAEASGKTSIGLTAIANVQKEGGTAVFLDVEQAFDPNYAKILGVDLDKIGFAQPTIAEDVLNMVKHLCLSKVVDLIVVDSVASMVPRVENDQDLGKSTIGLLARLLSQALKQISVVANQNNCTVIFLNQIRSNVGVMYGPSTTTTGGNALKFYASQRIEVKRKEKIEEDGNVIGNKVALKCIKNKIGVPYLEGSTVLTFAKGINQSAEIIEVGESLGVIEKIGRTSYFTPNKDFKFESIQGFNSTFDENEWKIKIGTSKKDTLKEIEDNKNLYDIISKVVVDKLKSKEGLGINTNQEVNEENFLKSNLEQNFEE